MPKVNPLPVKELLFESLGDSSSDYNDGDNCGWYSYGFDEATGLLRITYQPDDDPETLEEYRPKHCRTTVIFKYVGTEASENE